MLNLLEAVRNDMNSMHLGWQVFLTWMEDQECSIYINMGARYNVTLPHLAVVAHKLSSTTGRGFPEDAEYDALEAMEGAMIRVVRGLKGEYVGRYTCDGERVYYAYLPDEEAPDVLAKNLKSMPYDLEVEAAFDPDWERYRTALYPSAEELCCMKNKCMTEAMKESGIDLSVSRTVDHWLYFPTREARLGAEREARDQEFRTKRYTDKARKGAATWGLHLIKNHAVDRGTIDGVSLALMRIAERFEGQYDGWGVGFESAAPCRV